MGSSYGWRNAGVAPCLPGGHPTITFKDAKGGIAGVFVDVDFNVRELPVAEPGKAKTILADRMDERLSAREQADDDVHAAATDTS